MRLCACSVGMEWKCVCVRLRCAEYRQPDDRLMIRATLVQQSSDTAGWMSHQSCVAYAAGRERLEFYSVCLEQLQESDVTY